MRTFLALLASVAMVAALATAGPASAEQKPNTKPAAGASKAGRVEYPNLPAGSDKIRPSAAPQPQGQTGPVKK